MAHLQNNLALSLLLVPVLGFQLLQFTVLATRLTRRRVLLVAYPPLCGTSASADAAESAPATIDIIVAQVAGTGSVACLSQGEGGG
jgi:hypothetical protein